MKNTFITVIGVVGGFIASLFGGWNEALTTLSIFMMLDYATGLIVAGVFHNSPKTATGTFESRAGLKGLIRKGIMLAIVLVGHRLDLIAGTTYIKDGVCLALITNETISLVENWGLMGLPVPKVITNMIDILQKKGDSGNGNITNS